MPGLVPGIHSLDRIFVNGPDTPAMIGVCRSCGRTGAVLCFHRPNRWWTQAFWLL